MASIPGMVNLAPAGNHPAGTQPDSVNQQQPTYIWETGVTGSNDSTPYE